MASEEASPLEHSGSRCVSVAFGLCDLMVNPFIKGFTEQTRVSSWEMPQLNPS